jgi:hypothetical protein
MLTSSKRVWPHAPRTDSSSRGHQCRLREIAVERLTLFLDVLGRVFLRSVVVYRFGQGVGLFLTWLGISLHDGLLDHLTFGTLPRRQHVRSALGNTVTARRSRDVSGDDFDRPLLIRRLGDKLLIGNAL